MFDRLTLMVRSLVGTIAMVVALWMFTGCRAAPSNEAKDRATKQDRAAFQAAAAQLNKETGASLTWEKTISGRQDLDSLFSIDLEHVWMTESPIAFPGLVKDVATSDSENYRVVIKHVWQPELSLNLTCAKSVTDVVISKLRDLEKSGQLFSAGVIVAARINRVIRFERPDQVTDGRIEITTEFAGEGTCIGMVPVPDVYQNPIP
jgi:hypothetical protein